MVSKSKPECFLLKSKEKLIIKIKAFCFVANQTLLVFFLGGGGTPGIIYKGSCVANSNRVF